ncbi:nucleolar protein 14-like [Rhopilema esculentum]|uniref:nucleolar protein 14-like n=1 Tax=Rhopilema esculentum TaxID=499914 RepID=UPI0031DCD051
MKSKASKVEQRRRKKQNDASNIRANPFELRINRQKFKVIGRKSKHDRGLPGVSRTKAIKKRKETLLQEFKHRNKAGTFVDRRFGEFDSEMSLEERMLKRFTLEKQKHHESKKLYNLDDDEDLTHYGQSLGEMTTFDDADLKLTDDEEDNEDKTGVNNFGGFLKKVERPDGREEVEKQKSKKEIMEEIVAKSKLKKFERQKAKEEAFQLTQDLDSDWKLIQGLLSKREDEKSAKADDYDILVNELLYETKAKPKERMKTDEEIAKAEKEKLEKLEAERLERMLSKSEKSHHHLSADYLGERQFKKEDKRFELTFKDGKAVLPDEAFDTSNTKNDGLELLEPDVEDDEDFDDDAESGSEEEGEDDDFDEEADDDDAEDDEESDIGEEEADNVGKTEGKMSAANVIKKLDTGILDEASKEHSIMDTDTGRELPFTFKAPNDLQEFLSIVGGWPHEQQLCIIDRIRKCHPVKIDEKNKAKMETLFGILLEFIDHLCDQSPIPFAFINQLARPIFDLVKDSSYHCAAEVQRKLRHMFKRFWIKHQTYGGRHAMPDIKELILLVIISKVFPVSDLKHGITTPALIFMAAVLSKSHFQSAADLLSGLFISNILLEFQLLSKRFVPEVINFLCAVLSMATKPKSTLKYSPSLQIHNKNKNCLYLEDKTNKNGRKLKLSDLKDSNEKLRNLEVETRVSVLRLGVNLTKRFAGLYKDLSSYSEVFAPAIEAIKLIPLDRYPQQIQEEISQLRGLLENSSERQPLTLLHRKPIPLPLLEPKFDESYEITSKKRSKDKTVNERSKLKYKYKSEMKGAIREIRKDSQFLAKEKLHQTMQRDAERRGRTKEIERQLAEQQGELKALDKLKKKKR